MFGHFGGFYMHSDGKQDRHDLTSTECIHFMHCVKKYINNVFKTQTLNNKIK